jgi:glycosyltransferase
MKISIITICYNAEQHIATAVGSVLAAARRALECGGGDTALELEYLVVDGASKDATVDLVVQTVDDARSALEYGGSDTALKDPANSDCQAIYQLENLTVSIYSEPDEGLYDALNKGVQLASGEVIGFVHADDFLAGPDVLLKVAAAFATDPRLEAVYGDLAYVDREEVGRITRRWTSGTFAPKKLRRGWHPAHPSLYLKKSVYEQHGLFDTSLKIAADVEFMMRIFNQGIRAKYLPEVLVKMRAGGTTGQRQNILEQNRQVQAGMRKNGIAVSPLYWPAKLWNRGLQFLKGALQR